MIGRPVINRDGQIVRQCVEILGPQSARPMKRLWPGPLWSVNPQAA